MEPKNKDARLGFWATMNRIYHAECQCSGMVLQVARIEGKLTQEALTKALYVQQCWHPLLHCEILDFDDRYYYYDTKKFSGLSEEDRLGLLPVSYITRESDDQWKTLGEDEMNKDFEEGAPYLWRLTVIADPNPESDDAKHDLLFICHHSITDGLSTSRFIITLLQQYDRQVNQRDDAFLASLSDDARTFYQNHLPGETTLPMIKAVEQLIPKPTAEEKAILAQEEPEPTTEKANWPFTTKVPLEQRRNINEYVVLPENLMLKLRTVGKTKGVKMNAVLTAAITKACAEELTLEQVRRLVFSSAVNLRNFAKEGIGSEHFGSFVTVLQTQFELDNNTDFWDLAAQAQSILKNHIDKMRIQRFFPTRFNKAFIETSVLGDLEKSNDSGYFAYGPGISNLGVIKYPADYALKIKELYFSNALLAGHYKCFLSVITFEGKFMGLFNCTDPLMNRDQLTNLITNFQKQLEAAANS